MPNLLSRRQHIGVLRELGCQLDHHHLHVVRRSYLRTEIERRERIDSLRRSTVIKEAALNQTRYGLLSSLMVRFDGVSFRVPL